MASIVIRLRQVSDFELSSSDLQDSPQSKFLVRRRLIRTDASYGYFGYEIVFAFQRDTGHPPQHCELAYVGERVGDWSLK